MTDHSERPFNLKKYTEGMDAEQKAYFLRTSGFLDGDEDYTPAIGSGPEASLNRAIMGHDVESHLHHVLGDPKLVEEELYEREDYAREKKRAAAYLSRAEVAHAYTTATFLPQVYGLYFNAFITPAYKALGLEDPVEEMKFLTSFLDEAGGQMKRWGYPFHALYVHECSKERGRHTHILATIDLAVRSRFMAWARTGVRSFMWRHCSTRSAEAMDIQIKAPRSPRTQAQWQYDRLMYMTKGLDPEVMERDPETRRMVPLFELIGLKDEWRGRPAGRIPYKQRVGSTHSIGRGAQWRMAREEFMPALSPFRDKAWKWLGLNQMWFGWDLDEFQVRMEEMKRRRSPLETAKLFAALAIPPRPHIEPTAAELKMRWAAELRSYPVTSWARKSGRWWW